MNLTSEQKLVKPALDANPVPGHDLVLFRKLSEQSFRFHKVLGPNDRLGTAERMLLGSRLVAYAVTRDQNLRHRFDVQDLYSTDHRGPFRLSFNLLLGVADPHHLVEGLDRDPLGRLVKEAEEVLTAGARRMSSTEIAGPEDIFEDRLLGLPIRGVPIAERLRGFAEELGLALHDIEIERWLPDKYRESVQVAEAEEIQRKIDEQKILTQQLREQALGRIQRIGAISESATASLTRVISQIADKIDTAPALRGVLQELISMHQEILALSSGPASDTWSGSQIKIVRGADEPALLGSGRASGLSGLVVRSLRTIDGLGCEPDDKALLTSLTFHLIGELALRERADFEAVARYARQLEEQVHKVMPCVSTNEDRELLLQLQNPSAVRAAL